jgi:hypothetical protein
MTTYILPSAKIILTNEFGLIGTGYDYGLRSGLPEKYDYDSGSFGLPISDIRKLRFDLCLMIDSNSVPWTPFPEDLKNFFRFTLAREDGTVVTDEFKNFFGEPKTMFRNMVHYVNSYGSPYVIPAIHSETPSGNYTFTISTRQDVIQCLPARFFLTIDMENIWMNKPPEEPAIVMEPFLMGHISRKELNPLVPD